MAEKVVTYRQLDEVLRSYGFSLGFREDRTRVYKHDATGALVILPPYPLDQPVTPNHLVGTRGILQFHGIAEPADFTARLWKAS